MMPDRIIEQHAWMGRRLNVTWRTASFVPPRHLVTQASGICFTDDGLVVLVTADEESWGLPGGHPEAGETVEEAFVREVKEEACATVVSLAYLGAQEVNDPTNDEGPPIHYQARFWARVRLDEFKPQHECTGRKLAAASEINLSLRWNPHDILDAIMRAALECERRFAANGPSS